LEKIKYASVVDGKQIAKEYGVGALPALVFFRDGALLGRVEGYFEDGGAEKELLKKKIEEILE
jgi:thioredoxin-related protein